MKERPILFSGEMVRAILEGRKTVTRRVVKPQPKVVHAIHPDASITTERIFRGGDGRIHCPYGKPGDRLYVRETWATAPNFDHIKSRDLPRDISILRLADNGAKGGRWRPSIHMPRWASRITLEVTGIRVERVQEITKEGAKAEGVQGPRESPLCVGDCRTHYSHFRELWDSLNAKRGFGWDKNPWVWVVEFKKI